MSLKRKTSWSSSIPVQSSPSPSSSNTWTWTVEISKKKKNWTPAWKQIHIYVQLHVSRFHWKTKIDVFLLAAVQHLDTPHVQTGVSTLRFATPAGSWWWSCRWRWSSRNRKWQPPSHTHTQRTHRVASSTPALNLDTHTLTQLRGSAEPRQLPAN